MILHHYSDRLVDILISEIVSLFDIYSPHSMDYFNDELARFEQNILDSPMHSLKWIKNLLEKIKTLGLDANSLLEKS